MVGAVTEAELDQQDAQELADFIAEHGFGPYLWEQWRDRTSNVLYGPPLSEFGVVSWCWNSPTHVLAGKAICAACFDQVKASHSGQGQVYILGPFPWEKQPDWSIMDGYHCGDPMVMPDWTQPATKPKGYGGPSKMARWLPGGSKYTGALYGDNIKAAGPVGRQKSPVKQLEEASQRGYDRVHGSSNVTSNEAPIEEPTAAALAESSRLPVAAPEPAPAPQRAPERAQLVVMGGSGVPAPKARQEPRARSGEPSSVTDSASVRPVGFAVAADCPKCGGVGRIQKECWHWRVKGTGPQFAMVPCPKCRAGSPAGPRPVRASTPARQEAPMRALSDVMGVTTPVGQIAPQRAPSRAVADVEQWMAGYLGIKTEKSDEIGRLERLVADLRESLRLGAEEAEREAERYAEQLETIATIRAGYESRLQGAFQETERFRSEMVRAQREAKAYAESKVRVIRPSNAEVIEGEFVNA